MKINVQDELEKNLNSYAEKESQKGTSTFSIVKHIAQVIKPFAKVRRRKDIEILVKGLEQACENKDKKMCEMYIKHLQEAAKNEALLPFKLMKVLAQDIVNYKTQKNVEDNRGDKNV
jgi:glycosidase